MNTRNKIKILGNPLKDQHTQSVLASFIAPENLPRAYGGELEWSAGEPPNLDDAARTWLSEVMGLDGEVPIRGPFFVDPYAKDEMMKAAAEGKVNGNGEKASEPQIAPSKPMTEVDSGVGLEEPTPTASATPAGVTS